MKKANCTNVGSIVIPSWTTVHIQGFSSLSELIMKLKDVQGPQDL